MRLRLCGALAGLALAFAATVETPRSSTAGAEQAPSRSAGFKSRDVILDGSEHGNRLFPQFADFDGDGAADLVLGVGDRLLVYRNGGTNARPAYDKPTWFDKTEPTAHLPAG